MLIRFLCFHCINDSLFCILEVMHIHTAVFVYMQRSECNFLQKARGCYLELREKDVSWLDNASSFYRPCAGAKSHFELILLWHSPFKAPGSALKPQLSHSVAAV